MVVSVIVPTYNEQDNIPVLFNRLKDIAAQLTHYKFEFIFIDDCSNDNTPSMLEHLKQEDKRVEFIRFSRNFGSNAAVEAGLKSCRGDVAIMLAADLQDPPEIIPKLIEQWKKGFKVVWGEREHRVHEGFTERIFSRAYYFLMNRLTDVSQALTGVDVFLVDRQLIEILKKSSEKNTEIYMLIAWLGFSQTHIKFAKEARHAGSSKWTFSKRVKMFLDSLISFSYAPLRLMSLIGIILALLGLFYGLAVIIIAFHTDAPIEGWSSLMVIILLLGGFQMSMMGMLGEYLWRTYGETRGRPRYVIEKSTLLEDTQEGFDKMQDEREHL